MNSQILPTWDYAHDAPPPQYPDHVTDAQEDLVPFPNIYDGDEETCSICQSGFAHGQRVLRITCRHMFHQECWNDYVGTSSSQSHGGRTCPNCRGAGSTIAVWNYIEQGRITQTIDGRVVPNELEQSAELHDIATPETSSTPRSAQPAPGQAPGTSSQDPNPHLLCGSYPIHTTLADGRPSLIIDPGSVGNLCGDKWAKEVAIFAHKNGCKPTHFKRDTPLDVCGVGKGSQQCLYDCHLPIALQTDTEQNALVGTLKTPAVSDSDLPGLLGLTALRRNRAVLDFTTLKLYFCGPADYDVANALPEGTDTFQLQTAPSGHIVLPCCEFKAASSSDDSTLTLLSREKSRNQKIHSKKPQNGQTRHTQHDSVARVVQDSTPPVPPPPEAPPALPPTFLRRQVLPEPPAQSA